MIRLFCLCAALWGVVSVPAAAQELTALARVDVENSHIETDWRGRTEVQLQLSQGVPFRVFTLASPARLVIDFREADWSGVKADTLMRKDTGIAGLRFGVFEPGWSRLVADLEGPLLPADIAMELDETTGAAVLRLNLVPVEPDAFDAASGVPEDTLWPAPRPETPAAPVSDDRFVVVIDPGHGGLDPGAERNGLSEKMLMLDVAFELRDALMRAADVDVVLTRESDVFVSLEARVATAHHAKADVFLSLHADALRQGGAQGATIYLLSEEASDTASAHLAARHNRADIIAGADLSGSDDEITGVLLDLARQETEPRAEAFARSLVESLATAGGPMNTRPLRRAGFSVLKSADIPSVLVEVGFLSNPRDLENLRNPEWRSGIVAAMTRAILEWHREDSIRRTLVRQ